MGLDAAIRGLRLHSDVETSDLDIQAFIASLRGESDRGAIILSATMVDDIIAVGLREKMPGLNKKELQEIFDFNGAAGTFSSRIKLAQALGLLTREQRRQVDLLRHMRNACAHGRQEINFDTPEIRNAVGFLGPEGLQAKITSFPRPLLRTTFIMLSAAIANAVEEPGSDAMEIAEEKIRAVELE